MRRIPRWTPALFLVSVIGLALAGCGGEDGQPSATSGSTLTATVSGPGATSTTTTSVLGFNSITITRTGGLAGVNQKVVIEKDGSWTYTDVKKGTTETGKLTGAQLAQLGLYSAAQLIAEAQQTSTTQCADAFTYTIAASEDLKVSFQDCGGTTQQAGLYAVINLIIDATPL